MTLACLFPSIVVSALSASVDCFGVSLIVNSAIFVGNTMYRLNNERHATEVRVKCAMSCQVRASCIFFAVDFDGACEFGQDVLEGPESYYRQPLVTVEMKSRRYSSKVPGYIRIGSKHYESNGKGFNTMELAPNLSVPVNARVYDTSSSRTRANALVNYLGGLIDGTIVAGTSSTDASYSLKCAKGDLKAIGLNMDSARFKSNICFLYLKGRPEKTFVKILPHGYGDMYCTIRIYHIPTIDNKEGEYVFHGNIRN